MAVEVVNKKQTGSGSTVVLTITSATKGNLLVMFMAETTSVVSAPKPKDNINTSGSAWHVEETTKAVWGASANSLWVAWKVAEGGETTLEFTAGELATGQGISYFELSGATSTIDAIAHTDNQALGKTISSPSFPASGETEAGDIVLAAVATAAGGVGTISAWTGQGPMTNVSTTTTRVIGGSYIPAKTLKAVTFTANWETSRQTGMLIVAFKAAGGGHEVTASDTITVSESSTRSAALPRALADSVSVSESSARSAAHPRAAADTITISESAARSVANPRAVGDTVVVSESSSRAVANPRVIGDTITEADSAVRSAQALARTTADTIPLSEEAHGGVSLPRAVGDIVTESDAASASASRERSAADSVSISDSATRGAQSLSRTVAELISLAEQAGRITTASRGANDTILISDQAQGAIGQGRTASDTVMVSDAVARMLVTTRSVGDVITITDSASAQGPAGAAAAGAVAVMREVVIGVGISEASPTAACTLTAVYALGAMNGQA